MIGKQGPSITTRTAFVYDRVQSFQKVIAIIVILKNIAFFDSSDNDMVQGPGGIYAGFSWHELHIAYAEKKINRKTEGRPHYCKQGNAVTLWTRVRAPNGRKK